MDDVGKTRIVKNNEFATKTVRAHHKAIWIQRKYIQPTDITHKKSKIKKD